MKKLFALLLVIMLPLTAMAEAYIAESTIHADAAGIEALLSPVLAQMPASETDLNNDTLAQVIADILEGLGTRMCVSDDAISFDVLMDDSVLIDLIMYSLDEGRTFAITSTLIPGYALGSTTTAETLEMSEAFTAAMTDADWNAIGNEAIAAAAAWLSDIEYTEETGYFSGSTYEGGTRCWTWKLDDQDIATLMDSLLSEALEDLLTKLYACMGLDAAALFQQYHAANQRVAQENAYSYTLSLVYGQEGRLSGISLTAHDADKRTLLVSVGIQDSGVKAAAGLPYGDNCYWCSVELNFMQEGIRTKLTGSWKEYAAPMDMSHAYTELAGQMLISSEFTADITSEGDQTTWTGEADVAVPLLAQIANMPTEYVLQSSAKYDEQRFDSEASVKTGELDIIGYEFSLAPGGEIPPMAADLSFCDMQDDSTQNMDLFHDIIDKMGKAGSVRLIKLLPLDLIFRVPNLINIPE